MLKDVISDFLQFLNKNTHDYVLKGGNSLVQCYGSPRLSEDVDLDGRNRNKIADIVDAFCRERGYSYRVAKDTETTLRFLLHYGEEEPPLKIEISFRNKGLSGQCIVGGISVYDIGTLCTLKSFAYQGRDKIRDLYDITFIGTKYWEDLPESAKEAMSICIQNKGLEQFDYLVNNQRDEQIDTERLAEDFLALYEKLGLLREDVEKE